MGDGGVMGCQNIDHKESRTATGGFATERAGGYG